MKLSKELQEKINTLREVTFEMYPDAETELEFENPFQLLVAIIMSAQTTDKQVNKVNQTFFQVLKTPEDGIQMGVEKIKSHINTISFFNNKANNIYKTCLKLRDEHKSLPPRTIEELTTLHGVGIKTAKVFLAIIEDAPYLWVDTHVHRVLNRVGIVKAKEPLQTNAQAEKVFTEDDLAKLHHTLIFFGRYHCIARKPKCESCKVQWVCDYYKKMKKN